jgi:2-polyprenyl-6-methoxyphenol hydroxylase-like FAD-dependent oxidoreductase
MDVDIAVVGYGPVGNALAILLAQLGRTVTVLERWSEPYALPRAVHFDHEVGRILQSCGIGDGLRAIIEPADIYEWRNATGTTLLRFGQPGDGPSGWPASSMFNQPKLEQLLDRRARELGVDVRREGANTLVLRPEGGYLASFEDTNVRSRRIPNWLSLSGLLCGICLNSILEGRDGFVLSLLGIVTGFFLLFFQPSLAARN